MSTCPLPAKDPDDTDLYWVVWCDEAGVNDASANDHGELQGETISTSTWTADTGITIESSNTNSVTVRGVTYPVDTIACVKLSGGTAGQEYEVTNKITTSGGRTLSKTIKVPVAEQ